MNVEHMEIESCVFDSDGTYSRCCSVERDALENKLRNIYSSQWCEITSSGINAIFSTLYTIFENTPSAHLFYVSDEIFEFTKLLINKLSKTFQKTVVYFNVDNPSNLKNSIDILKRDICCIYLESCSNPTNKSLDLNTLSYISNFSFPVVVDNTWLSPVKFNPLDYGADVSIDSCTKYLSGGKCIAGCVNFKNYDDLSKNVAANISLFGTHVSKDFCLTILHRLESLSNRVNNATARTEQFYNFLMTLKTVDTIYYNKTMKPCVIQIGILIDETLKYLFNEYTPEDIYDAIEKIVTSHKILFETSFGKNYDSIDSYPKYYNGKLFLRVAIGYESNETFHHNIKNLINNLHGKL
jgi:cystathionine beta-lyase/cystathionine gamma-synthase